MDAEAKVIYSVAKGEIGVPYILKLGLRFLLDTSYNPEFSHLFDGRSATLSFSEQEAWSLARSSNQNRPAAKTALVINGKSQDFARMYLRYAQGNRILFHDLASAREWLGLPPEEE